MNELRGLCLLEISGDMPERFINRCSGAGIKLLGVRRKEPYKTDIIIYERDLDAAQNAAAYCSCEARLIKRKGARRLGSRIWKRLFPMLAALGFVSILFWSKFYVWEIEVSGNESVSTGKILDALSEAGVECGAFWPDFSADNIRSEVLVRLPELSWISVNMNGSLAEVIAVERSERPEMVYEGESADIVADHSGFVTAVEALVGQTEVRPGSAVNEGDILISGAVESSFAPPRFVRSQGSVLAEINSELTAVSPEKANIRRDTGKIKRKYAVIIGNNRINFYSGSSISHSFCDKIISVWKLEAEGLFSLPVSIVCEEEIFYEWQEISRDSYEVGDEMERALRESFDCELGDGEIISEKLSFGSGGGLITASLRTRCIRDIASLEPMSESRRAGIIMKYNEKADDDKWQNAE